MKPAPPCQACGQVVNFGEQVIRVQYGTMSSAVKHLRVTERKPDDYYHARCADNVAIRRFGAAEVRA